MFFFQKPRHVRTGRFVVAQCKEAGEAKITQTTKNGKTETLTETKPCKHINGIMCKVYMFPGAKWYQSKCPMRAYVHQKAEERKINPLKASKKSMGKK